MKKAAMISPLVPSDIDYIPCYIDSNITIENGQLVEATCMTSRRHKLLGICLGTGLMDEKLIKSGWRVDYYISAVYHKELTKSESKDFI